MTEHEQNWIEVKAMLQDRFGKVPDMEAILYLIGMNEVGFNPNKNFTKEQKQDLMHAAMCILMEDDGYYKYTHHDADGWPHFEKTDDFPSLNTQEQEYYLQTKILKYFNK